MAELEKKRAAASQAAEKATEQEAALVADEVRRRARVRRGSGAPTQRRSPESPFLPH